jgi:hypothetical protein
MQRVEAERFCNEINGIEVDAPYVADVLEIKNNRLPGFPAALVVYHTPSRNEIGYAETPDEARHVVRDIKRRAGLEV